MRTFAIILAVFTVILTSGSVFSQTKVGYVDSKKIIDAIPESRDAKARLDRIVTDWQTELSKLQDSLKLKKDDYDKKKLILTDQLKTQIEAEITALDRSINDFRVQKFGENGEYFQKQAEFMKPMQNRVFAAIEQVAKEEDFDYVIDKSGEISLLYFNERYDLTAKVLRIIEEK